MEDYHRKNKGELKLICFPNVKITFDDLFDEVDIG